MNPEDLKLLNKSLSESVNLFQSIHVLQSKEDELAFGNETSAGKCIFYIAVVEFYPLFTLPRLSEISEENWST